VTDALTGGCGPYDYAGITNSDGYNTWVTNNMWACGSVQPGNPGADCGPQTLTAINPGDWGVVSDQASGNTGVLTYPEAQQVFTLPNNTGPALSTFSSITSTFNENMNPVSGTDAEAAYDIWLTGTSGPDEVMIWVDNVGRGSGGATLIGNTTIDGQAFTVYEYGSSEIIVSLNQNELSGSVDILSTLQWLESVGIITTNPGLGQVDFGWEICSTGSQNETFTVSGYTLHSACATGATC
jgi:hypothetical protein